MTSEELHERLEAYKFQDSTPNVLLEIKNLVQTYVNGLMFRVIYFKVPIVEVVNTDKYTINIFFKDPDTGAFIDPRELIPEIGDQDLDKPSSL